MENGNNNGSFSWVFRDNSKLDWSINNNNSCNNDYTHPSSTPFPLMFNTTTTSPPLAQHYHHYQPSPYAMAEGSSHLHQDPYLTCLKLGKRHYFEDGAESEGLVDGFAKIEKRGRSYGVGGASSSASCVPRCQVEGCHLALVNAKEYHRRHKVCEMHSKSPQVVVLGIQQRFCQQCSRFHLLSEFDDTKRSCRRRLAGHNERRRKTSTTDPISRNHINIQEQRSTNGRFSYASGSPGRALSLLSSKTNSWISPPDLSSRSSAALRELIAENRAAVLTRQLFLQQSWHHQTVDEFGGNQNITLPHLPHQHQVFPDPAEWERFHEVGGQVTLDLMQEPSSAFGFLSGRSKPKDEEECCDIWKSLEGTHVV